VWTKDTLGNWNGELTDYYKDGSIQMRGYYDKGLQNGTFIFYHQNGKYASGGKFLNDVKVGAWKNYFQNGQLQSEILYDVNRSCFINVWDSLGSLQVKNGNGTIIDYNSSGKVKSVTRIKNGLYEGFCEQFNEDGQVFNKEYFENGNFIKGITYNNGDTYKYDISSYFPDPEGGFNQFYAYINKNKKLSLNNKKGYVEVKFRVDKFGEISNFIYLRNLGEPFDSEVKNLTYNGPKWLPAKSFGYLPISSDAFVVVEY
jgi:hypothetical protein